MMCPLCGYAMDAFDKVCPRCQNKAPVTSPLPTAHPHSVPAATNGIDPTFLSELPAIIRDKVKALSPVQQQEFLTAYRGQAKNLKTGYLCLLCCLHYAYLREWILFGLFLFSIPFALVLFWWPVDAVRMPRLIDEANRKIALNILNGMSVGQTATSAQVAPGSTLTPNAIGGLVYTLKIFQNPGSAFERIEGFTPSQYVLSTDKRSGIAVDQDRGLLCLMWLPQAMGADVHFRVLKPNEVVEVGILEDEHPVVVEKTSTHSGGTGIGIGGPVGFGLSAGVLTGGISTKGTHKAEQFGEVTRIDLRIVTNDLSRPLHTINFMKHWKTNKRGHIYPKAREKADYWHALLCALVQRG